MTADPARAKAIFLEAIGKHASQDWDAYLRSACGDDATLRRQIMILLEAHQQAGSFLDAPAVAKTMDMPAGSPIAEGPGTQIGPYKLLEPIVHGHADCMLSSANGVLALDSTGGDPVFIMPAFKAGPGRKVLTICARFQGKQAWQVFLSTMDWSYTEDDSLRFVMDGGDGEWREHRVTFDRRAEMTSLRFDPPNEAGIHLELGWIILADDSAESEPQRAVEHDDDVKQPVGLRPDEKRQESKEQPQVD